MQNQQSTIGNSIPKINLPGEDVQGHTTVTKESKDHETGEVVSSVSDAKKYPTGWMIPASDEPMVNVQVGLGALVALPEYSNVRYNVEITLPTVPHNEQIDEAYEFAREWCLEKMHDLAEKVLK